MCKSLLFCCFETYRIVIATYVLYILSFLKDLCEQRIKSIKIMRKKIILTVFVLFINMTFSLAQDFKLSVEGGVNLSSINGDNLESTEGLLGGYIGVKSDIKIFEKIYLEPGLQYSMQGFKWKIENVDTDEFFEDKYMLSYLNFPLTVKYFVVDGFSLSAGPQLGLLLAAKDKWSYKSLNASGNTYDEDSGEENVKDFFESFDYGLKLGLGYRLSSGITFNASYFMGLSEPFKNINTNNHNATIQLGIGYYFN